MQDDPLRPKQGVLASGNMTALLENVVRNSFVSVPEDEESAFDVATWLTALKRLGER